MINLLKGFAFTGGEWVIYLLIFASIVSLAVILERGIILSKEIKELEKVKKILEKEETQLNIEALKESLSSISGLSATVLLTGLSQAKLGADAAEEWFSATILKERKRLEEHLIILGTLGNNAIYIGLFGTVLGVIKAFHDLAQSSGLGPEVVMQGLSEALIATAVGLLVAIPSVIAYNFFQKAIKDIQTETDSISKILLAKLKS